MLNRTYTLEDYRQALGADPEYEVEAAVYVEVDCAKTDKDRENAFIIGCCGDEESLFRGAILSGYLHEDGFKEYMSRYLGTACVKGVRQVLHVPEALPGTCLGQAFEENVRWLGEQGLVYEGCVRNQELGDLYEMAAVCPGTTVVLDHMGIVDPDIISRENPTAQEKAYKAAWVENINRLASLPNVVCKISGLNPAGAWTDGTLRPAVDIALDAFGEDRVMYASNFPVCNVATGMAPWVGALLRITEGRGEAFRRKLFSENARRIYKL